MTDDGAANYASTGPLRARGDFHARHGSRDWHDWVAAHLPDLDGKRVLDAGCGPGWLWQPATAQAAPRRLILLDRSPAMVGDAMSHLAPLTPLGVVADLARLPLPDASVEMAVAAHVLYHLPEPQTGVAELRRVLVPDGWLIVTTMGDEDLGSLRPILRVIYGFDPTEAIRERFGALRAARLLRDRFPDVEAHRFVDRYRIEDVDTLADYLLSIPPGPALDAAGRRRAQSIVAEAIARGGGRIETWRRQSLFVARLPN